MNASLSNLTQMLSNSHDLINALVVLVMVIGAIMGVFLFINGVITLNRMGDARGGGRDTWAGVFATFLVGVVLMSAPRMMDAFSMTMFQQQTVVADVKSMKTYVASHNSKYDALTQAAIAAAMGWVMFLGWVYFIRGWLMLRDHAMGRSQASPGAAATHMFAGCVAANITLFADLFEKQFGVKLFGI